MPSFKSKLLSRTIKRVKPLFTSITIPRQRRGMQLLGYIRPKPQDIKLEKAQDCPLPAKWAIPENLLSGKMIMYTHGGSYVSGSPDTHIPIISRLAEKSHIPVLAYDYRLAPEHPYPAALHDALAVYDYIVEKGYSEKDIIVCGDSAGGGLTLALIMMLRDQGRTLPAAICVISPWTDLTESSDSHFINMELDPLISSDELRKAAVYYAGGVNLCYPYISPLYGDFTGFPPTLIHVGSNEVLLDDSKSLVTRMQEQGTNVHITVYKGMWHVFHMFDVPEAYEAIQKIVEFIYNIWGIENNSILEKHKKRVVHPGAKYSHFKGEKYRVLYIVRNSETLEEMVVYQQLYGKHSVWVLPIDMFLDTVKYNGKYILRFKEVNSK